MNGAEIRIKSAIEDDHFKKQLLYFKPTSIF